MKKNQIISGLILFLFMSLIFNPIFLVNSNREETFQGNIWIKEIQDSNKDKIDDELYNKIKYTTSNYLDVVLKYDRSIKKADLNRLRELDVKILSGAWDLGRRIHVSTSIELLKEITSLSGLSHITTSEKRLIMVAIEGTDFTDLKKLTKLKGAEIFWNVGCALIPYFSGIENDIKDLGTYNAIIDTTNIYFQTTTLPDISDNYEINTITNANTINASSLWNLGYNGTGIKVGNIDTGINHLHEDLAGRINASQSFVLTIYGYEEDDLTTTDDNGHGTHTSGIIAGNGTGIATYTGIAPCSELIFAKVGSSATLPSVVAALDWLITKGAETVNLSFGGSDTTGKDIVEIAFSNAVRNHDILISVSAGNEGGDGFYTAGTPGTTDDVITVGNVNDAYNPPTIVYSSSSGPTADDHMKPDLMAPGNNIMSCYHIGVSGYVPKSGTSMAAPQVTGSIALMIQACKANGINYNPGLLKSALMKTAELITPISSNNLLTQGRGVVNVGAAWNYILNSEKEGLTPIIGACNPIQEPLHYWSTLLQGQIAEQYLTCVSPFKTDLSIEKSGDTAVFITIDTIPEQYTAITKIIFDIPLDATLGTYTGQLSFKYKTYTLDTVTINLEISESNGYRMLLNYRTTDYSIDHMYGQFKEFTEDILINDYIISEQNVVLDSSVLANYEAVWLPDPFNYYYPLGDYEDYSIVETNPYWAVGEIDALTDYIENGGTVFFCFIGQLTNAEETLLLNTNVSAVNEFTEQYGIHVRNTNWTAPTQTIVDTVGIHPLTFGVDSINHYGCSLELTGDAVQVTELSAGSEYATCAYAQTASGGRVIVLTTNFVLDNEGYNDLYDIDQTQNKQFGRNLIRWGTAKNRINLISTIEEEGKIIITYEYQNGLGADFGGYVITPSSEQINLVWNEIETNIWQTNYYFSELGIHHFFPECGPTGIDDFDYFVFNADQIATEPSPSPTPSNTTTTTSETGVIFLTIVVFYIVGMIVPVIIKKYRK